jgi:NADH-quinone oxidoreductase subunit M
MSYPWLTTLGAIPLAGSLAVIAIPAAKAELAKRVALLFSVGALGVAIAIAAKFNTGAGAPQFQFVESHEWISAFHIRYELGVDGVALALILMAAILVPLVIIAAWRDADKGAQVGASAGGSATGDAGTGDTVAARRVHAYFALTLLLEAMMFGVFEATDIFLFYVFFEVILIPMYFLIGAFGGPQRSYAAVKFLLYNLLGGLLMLAAVIGLYVVSTRSIPGGSFDFQTLANAVASGKLPMAGAVSKSLFLGFMIAFAVKAPLFPFHTWLPDAAAEATPGSAVLMIGVLDKIGSFGMLRYCLELFPGPFHTFTPLIIVLAVIGTIYGALLAIGQTDIKRLIAYTSISHFGLITIGIFALTSQGQAGATLYMVNHGFSTGALFLVAGFLISRRGSRFVSDYGGVQKVAPVLAGTFLLAGLSGLALPGLSTFVSEFLVLIGTFERYRVAAIFGTTATILAALYILWMYQRTMTGPVAKGSEAIRDLSRREVAAVAPLLAIIVFLGVYPKPALDIIDPAVNQTLSHVHTTDPASTVGSANSGSQSSEGNGR